MLPNQALSTFHVYYFTHMPSSSFDRVLNRSALTTRAARPIARAASRPGRLWERCRCRRLLLQLGFCWLRKVAWLYARFGQAPAHVPDSATCRPLSNLARAQPCLPLFGKPFALKRQRIETRANSQQQWVLSGKHGARQTDLHQTVPESQYFDQGYRLWVTKSRLFFFFFDPPEPAPSLGDWKRDQCFRSTIPRKVCG